MAHDTLRPAAATSRPVPLGVRATTWLLLAVMVCLAVMTAVVAAHWAPLMRLDHAVARTAFDATSDHPLLASWWRGVAMVTEPINLRVLMLITGLLLLWRGNRWPGHDPLDRDGRDSALGGRLLGGWLVGVALLEQVTGPYAKYLLNRPRPHWAHPLDVLHTTSFPAGHATGIACFASVLALLALTVFPRDRRRARGITLGVAGFLVLLVSADRLLLGMHYLSDVVAGLLLGVATTLVCWLAALLLHRRHAG